MNMSKLYMGVEIGGTKQQILVIDENGTIIDKIADRFRCPTARRMSSTGLR